MTRRKRHEKTQDDTDATGLPRNYQSDLTAPAGFSVRRYAATASISASERKSPHVGMNTSGSSPAGSALTGCGTPRLILATSSALVKVSATLASAGIFFPATLLFGYPPAPEAPWQAMQPARV